MIIPLITAQSRDITPTRKHKIQDRPADEADGCAWVSSTTETHYVPVIADDIRYRVTVTNPGASALNDVVWYDVLPHVGDTGLLAGAASRGSEFDMVLQSVDSVPAGITMAFSSSTNPTRPEVYPGAPGAVDDWDADPTNKRALRMVLDNPLAGGASVQVEFTAAVIGSPEADERACNTVALDSAESLPTEPAAVCVTLTEADLAIELTSFENLQAGRPGSLAYTVTNFGGSAQAPASVEIEIPEGLTVTSLNVLRWSCQAVGGGSAPVSGPATLACDPVDDTQQPRTLELDVAEVLSFATLVDVESGELCTSATVTGDLYDPIESNNSVGGCDEVAAPPAGLVISKDDGQTATTIGAEYTYTISISNTLLGEAVNDAVVTDTVPDALQIIATDGDAVVAGQTVTWSLAGLAPLATVEVSVTVRVLASAESPLVNTASVTAPDPGFPSETLSDSDTDSNDVLRVTVTKESDARPSGVREGDVVTYTVTVRGDDAGDHAGATIVDDLSDVLDEASFVTDSASISIDGGTAEPVADPVGSILSWTGMIPAGAEAVLSYQVIVEESVSGQLVNTVSTSHVPSECDVSTGLDENGMACAVLRTPFAPTVTKTVESLTQADDGSWEILYSIEVINPAPAGATYDLADSLAFGPGITVLSATVDPPAGVTAEAWDGSGVIVLDGSVDANTTHHYTITVVADAGTVAGTAAAVCTSGAALGFANQAIMTLSDGTELEAVACAEPVEPTVTKELDGDPAQGVDGRWTVTYRVTVTNEAEEPESGLAYRLDDSLDFPAGLTIDEIVVTAPATVTANAGFTGGLTEIGGVAVPADSDLIDGVARIPAATDGSSAVHEYVVRLVVTAGAGSVDPEWVTCGPPGAGYGNWVSLLAGTAELGRATACADIRLPELHFTKVAGASNGTRPGDRVTYTIIATNVGDADFTAGDPAELVDDMSGLLDDARYLNNATAGTGIVLSVPPALIWTGALPAGETVEITYSVLLDDLGSGDGIITNQVRLASLDNPSGVVPECADTPEGNAGEPACVVTLELDTRSLAFTGAIIPLFIMVVMALVAIALGVVLTRRRSRALMA